MLRWLKNVVTRSRRLGTPGSAPGHRVVLRVETLEDRLAPSATPAVPLPRLAAAPASLAALPLEAGGGIHRIQIETPVHGYKWRPRWPRALGQDATPAMLLAHPLAGPVSGYHPPAASAAHLIGGGADQALVTIGANGHFGTQTPEGPVPTENLARAN
jgi:hypothetical protein